MPTSRFNLIKNTVYMHVIYCLPKVFKWMLLQHWVIYKSLTALEGFSFLSLSPSMGVHHLKQHYNLHHAEKLHIIAIQKMHLVGCKQS